MDIYTVIRVSKKLFDHGYAVIPEHKVDFKSALLLGFINTNAAKLIYVYLVDNNKNLRHDTPHQ